MDRVNEIKKKINKLKIEIFKPTEKKGENKPMIV